MPSFRQTVTLGALATNNNIMAGSIYEFPNQVTRVVISAVSALPTTTMGVNFGSRTIASAVDNVIPTQTAVNVGPVVPDDIVVDDVAMPGERLVISLTDGGAGAANRVFVQLTPVG